MRISPLLAFLVTLGASSPGSADRVIPSDFAFGLELSPIDEHAEPQVHAFELPERVLSALVDRDLGDLCVFDAHDQQLAHGLSEGGENVEEPSQLEVKSYFPLEVQSEARTGDVEVTVTRSSDGSIAHAYSRPVVASNRHITGYLVDLSELASRFSFEALSLPLRAEHDFSVEVSIESSADLSDFQPLTVGTLARFERDGQTLRRELIEFASTRAPYLRISFLDPPAGLTVEGMRLRVRPAAVPQERRVLELKGSSLANVPEQLFLFTLKGAFRPDRYDLKLPPLTALIEAELASGPTDAGPFHELDHAVFRRGGESERPLARSEDTFYRLRVANKGGGVREGLPVLRLGYLAPRLLLAAEGNGPYLLAYGSGAVRCKQFDASALRNLTQGSLPKGDSLRIVRSRALGGEALLSKQEKPRSSRVFILWLALFVAVGVLGVIARKLVSKV